MSEVLAPTLRAEVVAVRFAGDDFAVLAAVTDEGEEVTLTGALAHVAEGESVEVAGAWKTHPKHGRQFVAQRVRVLEPVSVQALTAVLLGVKHVGIAGAKFLLDKHGADVLAALDADPAGELRQVPGIGKAKLRAAVSSWEEQRAGRALRLFLEEHGVSAADAARIQRAYGTGAVELLRDDPYAITQLDGVGFATADALARALGVPADSPGRLEAGLVHVLREAEADGHCHLPADELAGSAARLLGVAPAAVPPAVERLAALGRLVVDPPRAEGGPALVLDARMDAVERRLAAKVRELLDAGPCLEVEVPAAPPEDVRVGGLDITAAQWEGVRRAVEHRVSILTGLPGTGKTATMRALVELLQGARKRVRLCAPTGKAARRLAESTGADASTIHRLLDFLPGEGFGRDAGDPIPGADVLIVDEASMLDVRLAAALFEAVGPRTHVLLVGDVDQLAPVGPGRVLADLLDAQDVPATRLTEIFRQAERSLIIRAAHAINRGEAPPTAAGEDDLRDFFWIARDGGDAIFAEAVSLAAQRLPVHYGVDPAGGVQVLAPMYRGPAGIDAFNAALRERLNPDGAEVPGTPFRVGDRLVQQRNDHDAQLMNGETAMVLDVEDRGPGPGGARRARRAGAGDDEDEDAGVRVTLRCDDGRVVRLAAASLDTWRLGWCTSVHKAQGSQFPVVVVVLSTAHRLMLTRSLLYTAVTRAERACVLVGEPAALGIALRTLDARRRHTRLARLVAAG